ncbi:Cupredoxin [Artemisia annua]|uniref:Cupredoxin n=1 Tax=Artemisia annua TaxID=35608 RepID=A0A2U1KXV7_ARTAN|nr:Cupredoxin [Artemisia annua]
MARVSIMRILMVFAATAMLVDMVVAVDITVGSPNGGWDLTTDLSSWASSQTFSVGDNLDFQFTSAHDVLEVTKENYDSCGLGSPISTTVTSPARFPLAAEGSRYFICGRGNHCSQGMKVQINVGSGTSTPTPPSSTIPPANGPTAAMLVDMALAVDIIVGSPNGGWDLSTDLSSWASSQTFSVGDNLDFQFTSAHDVLEVTRENYDSCGLGSPISTTLTSPARFPLTAEGSRYFICGRGTHCSQGMKVQIDVGSPPPPSSSITLKMTAGSILGFGVLVMMLLSL